MLSMYSRQFDSIDVLFELTLDVYKFYEEFDTTPRWKIGSYKLASNTELDTKRLKVCVAHHMALISMASLDSA